jgi:hypothetical protein
MMFYLCCELLSVDGVFGAPGVLLAPVRVDLPQLELVVAHRAALQSFINKW